MPLYYGQDANENTAGWLGVCIGFYLIYKAITSSNYVTSKRGKELVAKESDFIVDEKVNEFKKEEPIETKIVLKGSLANCSLKKAAVENESSKGVVNEDANAQFNPVLKGSLAGLSLRNSEHKASEDTE